MSNRVREDLMYCLLCSFLVLVLTGVSFTIAADSGDGFSQQLRRQQRADELTLKSQQHRQRLQMKEQCPDCRETIEAELERQRFGQLQFHQRQLQEGMQLRERMRVESTERAKARESLTRQRFERQRRAHRLQRDLNQDLYYPK